MSNRNDRSAAFFLSDVDRAVDDVLKYEAYGYYDDSLVIFVKTVSARLTEWAKHPQPEAQRQPEQSQEEPDRFDGRDYNDQEQWR